MKRFLTSASVLAASIALTGCSLLYPNWGTTEKPSDPQTSAPASETPTTTTTVTPTESPTSAAPVQKAIINLIQSGVDSNNNEVYAVAEITNAVEDGGQCTLTFTSGTFTKSLIVKAESNVKTTQCFPMNLSTTGFPKGPGFMTIGYSSKAFKGTSSAIPVTIP
jgi:hypothetical protein